MPNMTEILTSVNDGPEWTLKTVEDTGVEITHRGEVLCTLSYEDVDRMDELSSMGIDIFEKCHEHASPHDIDKFLDTINFIRYGNLLNPKVQYELEEKEGYSIHHSTQRVIGAYENDDYRVHVATHPYDAIVDDGWVMFTIQINDHVPVFIPMMTGGNQYDAISAILLRMHDITGIPPNQFDVCGDMVEELTNHASKTWDTEVDEEEWWSEYDPQDHPDHPDNQV